jgi:signal transduction histidine kinase/CheY-like chemotaxis protein
MKRFAYFLFIIGLLFSPFYLFSQQNDTTEEVHNGISSDEETVVELIHNALDLLNTGKYLLASDALLMASLQSDKLTETSDLSILHLYLAELYRQATLYTISLDYSKQALDECKIINDFANEIKAHLLIASNYAELNKYDSADISLKSALKLAQNNGRGHAAAFIFAQLADLKSLNQKFEEAAMYHQSANLILQSGDQHENLAINYYKIAKNLLKQGKIEHASSNFKNALHEAQLANSNEFIAKSAHALGDIYFNDKNKTEALKYFQRVTDLNDSENIFKTKSLSHQKSGQIQEELGKLKQALQSAKQNKIYALKAEKYTSRISAEQLQLRSHLIESNSKIINENLTEQLASSKQGIKSQSILLIGLSIIIIAMIVSFWLKYKKTVKTNSKQLQSKDEEIKQLKESLRDFNSKLESEISLRTKEIQEELNKRKEIDLQLKKALKNAEDANYLKNAFLSNMSHEIRTPLNGIIGFSNLLVTELSIMENQELYEFANGIQQSGDRLLHLLNNIIDISRIEANDMEVKLAPCNINEVIERVADLYKFKANEKRLKFNTKYNEVPDVLVDEQNITKIISDIIDNSVKYTEKGFINVITDYMADESRIVISIKDTGIGIDESYLKHVFEAFRQESLGYSRNYQGAGLGLPLAKRMVTLMNGDIKVESSKGVGTTVKIFLKTSASPAKIAQKEKPIQKVISVNDREDDKKINIFIVEDDRMNRLVLSKMLDKVGNNSLAVDGDETLSIIERAYQNGVVFDVMLFDINLPAPWDGIKLMHEIKQRWKEYKFIPFIAQTAYAMAGDRERLLDSGFDNYIAKPVNKNELIGIIFKHIGITDKN